MTNFDLEEEIFKNVDQDPKESVPYLLSLIKEKVHVGDPEARNMLLYSQQAVIRSLHSKISDILHMKEQRNSAFINFGSLNEKLEIPVKSIVDLETTLQNVAQNTFQPLNLNPLIVLQSAEDESHSTYDAKKYGGYPAIEPSTMQQLLILAPTSTTPVLKGPVHIKNPQLSVACPVNCTSPNAPESDSRDQDVQERTRSGGLDEKELDMIAKKYMIPIPASDESSKLEELEAFAKDFRTRRIRLGYTQNDVGLSLGKIYSSDFSQTTVSRFEALNLSFKNMVSLKPFMEKWIDDAERHKTLIEKDASNLSMEDQKTLDIFTNSTDNLGHRKRKRRTHIDIHTRKALEQYYKDKPHPSNDELCAISEALDQDRNTVRIWFGNRRQKERKLTSFAAPTASFGAAFAPPPCDAGSGFGDSCGGGGVASSAGGVESNYDYAESETSHYSLQHVGTNQQSSYVNVVTLQQSESSAFVQPAAAATAALQQTLSHSRL